MPACRILATIAADYLAVQTRLAKLPAALPEFRWMMEELRVSLFAQELKTPYPVSGKRLQKVWDGIKP